MSDNIDRLREIIRIAHKLKWINPSANTSYPLMQLSEVEKCMLAMIDEDMLNLIRRWEKNPKPFSAQDPPSSSGSKS